MTGFGFCESFIIIASTLIFINLLQVDCKGSCQCRDQSWCKPIEKNYQRENFIFSLSSHNWLLYDWDKITTIAEVGYHNESLLCHAHSLGARVVVSLANFHPTSQLVNKTARSEWINSSLTYVRENFLDGINLDFESPIFENQTDVKAGLTALVQELRKAMKDISQHLQFRDVMVTCKKFDDRIYCDASFYPTALKGCHCQGIVSTHGVRMDELAGGQQENIRLYCISETLTFDFAWSPECIDSRCYDYKGLTDASDFVYIMAYDERSQIFGPCVAWANSAVNQTVVGLQAYEKLGVPQKKLVLGVPWYGYVYQCDSYQEETKTCYMKEVPFRGVNCSDAAGHQSPYSTIVETLLPNSQTGRLWDDQAKSPYFTYQDPKNKQTFQVWYDDPTSLKVKYNYALDKGLRGVGMWEADQLDYSGTTRAKLQREAMWGALPSVK